MLHSTFNNSSILDKLNISHKLNTFTILSVLDKLNVLHRLNTFNTSFNLLKFQKRGVKVNKLNNAFSLFFPAFTGETDRLDKLGH